jgi:hypothetical protein
LPRIGSATADASMGAEMTHASTVSVVFRSCEMSPSETTRIVTGNVVANMPVRAVTRTHRR